MALGKFFVTIDVRQLGLAGDGAETGATLQVRFSGNRAFIRDADTDQIVFPHASANNPVSIGDGLATLELKTDVPAGSTGVVSETIGYDITIHARATGGRLNATNIAAKEAGTTWNIADLVSDFEGLVAESLAVRAETAATDAEQSALEAAAFGGTNDAIVEGFVSDPASATHAALSATFAAPVILRGAGIDPTGATDSTAAIQAKFTEAEGRTLLIPDGTYKFSTTIDVPDPIKVECESRSAVLAYVGSGKALRVVQAKNVAWQSGHIDLTNATGGAAIGLALDGLWFGHFDELKITQQAGSTGIQCETNFWGSYVVRLSNLDLRDGVGAYGVRTFRTPGDDIAGGEPLDRNVTHLYIDGGWIYNKDYGLHLSHVHTGRVDGMAAEVGANDGIYVADSSDVRLSPGEIGGFTGWGMNFGTGNLNLSVVTPSQVAASLNTAGFINTANHRPVTLDRGTMRLRASTSAENYYFEIQELFTYAKSLVMNVRGGGGSALELLAWGDAAGLTIDPGGAGGTTYIKRNLKTDSLQTWLQNASSSYAVGTSEQTVLAHTAGITITLPAPTTANKGRLITVKNTSAGAVSVAAASGGFEASGASVAAGATRRYVSDGGTWWNIT